MTDRPKPPAPDHLTPNRQARLAAALRDNLKKRKAQARARTESEAAAPTSNADAAAKKPNPKP